MTREQAEYVFEWFGKGAGVDGPTLDEATRVLGTAWVERWVGDFVKVRNVRVAGKVYAPFTL